MTLTKVQLLEAYRKMRTIREFEENIHRENTTGEIPGLLHLYCGQEANAVGVCVHLGDAEGFVKTIFDARSGELLGVHMIGPEVTEQIQGFSIARSLEATEEELAQTIFPHPTLSEAMHESVLNALGRGIHQ